MAVDGTPNGIRLTCDNCGATHDEPYPENEDFTEYGFTMSTMSRLNWEQTWPEDGPVFEYCPKCSTLENQ